MIPAVALALFVLAGLDGTQTQASIVSVSARDLHAIRDSVGRQSWDQIGGLFLAEPNRIVPGWNWVPWPFQGLFGAQATTTTTVRPATTATTMAAQTTSSSSAPEAEQGPTTTLASVTEDHGLAHTTKPSDELQFPTAVPGEPSLVEEVTELDIIQTTTDSVPELISLDPGSEELALNSVPETTTASLTVGTEPFESETLTDESPATTPSLILSTAQSLDETTVPSFIAIFTELMSTTAAAAEYLSTTDTLTTSITLTTITTTISTTSTTPITTAGTTSTSTTTIMMTTATTSTARPLASFTDTTSSITQPPTPSSSSTTAASASSTTTTLTSSTTTTLTSSTTTTSTSSTTTTSTSSTTTTSTPSTTTTSTLSTTTTSTSSTTTTSTSSTTTTSTSSTTTTSTSSTTTTSTPSTTTTSTSSTTTTSITTTETALSSISTRAPTASTTTTTTSSSILTSTTSTTSLSTVLSTTATTSTSTFSYASPTTTTVSSSSPAASTTSNAAPPVLLAPNTANATRPSRPADPESYGPTKCSSLQVCRIQFRPRLIHLIQRFSLCFNPKTSLVGHCARPKTTAPCDPQIVISCHPFPHVVEALFNAFSKHHDMLDKPKAVESLLLVTSRGRALSLDDVSASWSRVRTAMLASESALLRGLHEVRRVAERALVFVGRSVRAVAAWVRAEPEASDGSVLPVGLVVTDLLNETFVVERINEMLHHVLVHWDEGDEDDGGGGSRVCGLPGHSHLDAIGGTSNKARSTLASRLSSSVCTCADAMMSSLGLPAAASRSSSAPAQMLRKAVEASLEKMAREDRAHSHASYLRPASMLGLPRRADADSEVWTFVVDPSILELMRNVEEAVRAEVTLAGDSSLEDLEIVFNSNALDWCKLSAEEDVCLDLRTGLVDSCDRVSPGVQSAMCDNHALKDAPKALGGFRRRSWWPWLAPSATCRCMHWSYVTAATGAQVDPPCSQPTPWCYVAQMSDCADARLPMPDAAVHFPWSQIACGAYYEGR